jgi:eukaryotic-like serine/threonine-protein kinase
VEAIVAVMGAIYAALGQHDKALARAIDASHLDPSRNSNRLVASYLVFSRLNEARAAAARAQEQGYDSPLIHFNLYQIAFLEDDTARMAKLVAKAAGRPGEEAMFLELETETAAYCGRLRKARELSQQAAASAEGAKEKETSAGYEANAALIQALVGNMAEARQGAIAALRLSTGRDVQYLAALALAIAGNATKAQELVADLARRFPEDTIVQFNYLPTIRAQIALSRNNPSQSIDTLIAAAPYELGRGGNGINGGAYLPALHPMYVRGEAYLAAHRGSEAAAEFQKILDHRGIVVNQPIGALAHLQIGRAYAMQGDTARAKAAYQDFLTLWKGADPDIPILKEAKTEYARLQ